jgi:CubicO group peptidase (beta-lactamase class C family)
MNHSTPNHLCRHYCITPTLLLLCCTLWIQVAFAESSGQAAVDPIEVGLSGDRLARIDGLVQGYVDDGRLPGAVFAVARHGRTARIGAVGSLQPEMLFRIYSMTKPITVVAVLMLYEEGRFLLSDPVSRYLPEFTEMRVYVGEKDKKGSPVTRPAMRPITIEDLLTHKAGLSYDDVTAAGVPKLYAEADLWSVDSLADFTAKVAALPLAFEPGSRWHYSVAHDVLGRLVEVIAGQPFDEFLKARILGPLKMNDTAFYVPDTKLDRFASGYRRDGNGMRLIDPPEESEYRNPEPVPFGGSGLVSTAADYMRFAQMLLNGGELDSVRLLGRKTVELMMMDHLGPGFASPRLNDSWVGRTENRSGDMHLGFGYGFGGYVITDVAQNDVPGSVGTYAWGGGASTYFFIDPQEELIGLFFTQLEPSDSYPLRSQFRGLVYQAIVD